MLPPNEDSNRYPSDRTTMFKSIPLAGEKVIITEVDNKPGVLAYHVQFIPAYKVVKKHTLALELGEAPAGKT